MARPETLIPGNCYFTVAYYDTELLLPTIDTLVYVGQEDFPEHGRMWLFKEPEGETDSDEQTESVDEPWIAFTDKQLHFALDFAGLLQKLRAIAVDHPLKAAAEPAAAPATDEEFGSLPSEVARFLDNSEYIGLTITIRFTDDGFSLGCHDGGYDMEFFTHPRLDPDEDSKILSLFAGIGLPPVVDYYCDRGRTRVLQFPISRKLESIVPLCRRVLTEVYSMREGDVLDYHLLRKSDVV